MANNQEEIKATPVEHNKPQHSILSSITLVVALVAIAVASYTMVLNQQLQKKLNEGRGNLTTELAELKTNQVKAQEQVDAKADSIQQSQNELQEKFATLHQQLQTAMNQQLYQNQDWLLLKARYYLELAQINGYWTDNIKTTVALLEQADALLKQLNDPKIFDIRQAIAKEVAVLKGTEVLDVTGLLSRLDAAQTSVSNLTVQSPASPSENATPTDSANDAKTNAWRAHLQESMHLLKQIVVVRREDENIKPLMSPLFESILRESIRMNIQEAEWAVLNNNPAVYELALKQATINLKRTFKADEPNTAALISQLTELQAIQLTQEKPPAGTALPLLNHLIESKELHAPAEKNSKGENP